MEAAQGALDWFESSKSDCLSRLLPWLRIPSISTAPEHRSDCRKAALWIAAYLRDELACEAEIIETQQQPLVVARSRWDAPTGAPHLLFYGHYDVQPATVEDGWGSDPFDPVIRTVGDEERIYGRGTADDKGQSFTFVEACRAYLQAGQPVPCKVTFVFDGEEECGGTSARDYLDANAASLGCDVAAACDTNLFRLGVPGLTVCCRGMVYEEVTVSSSAPDLHSGMFGGLVRNPLHALSAVIAKLTDPDGSVAIPDFHEGIAPFPHDVVATWRDEGPLVADVLGSVGASNRLRPAFDAALEVLLIQPSCDVNGLWGGYIGTGAKTVIPSEATAKLSFRIVPGQHPDRVRSLFRAWFRRELDENFSCRFKAYEGVAAQMMRTDSPYIEAARNALTKEWAQPGVLTGLAGTLPIMQSFASHFDGHAVLLGFGTDEDRVHSTNESYSLSSFRRGIRSWCHVLEALGQVRR